MPRLNLPETRVPDRWLDSPSLPPSATTVLAELEGPGCIRHIWAAIRPHPGLNRQMILRIFWDGEEEPSVEAPIGDFFGLCHGVPYYEINSRYLTVAGQSGMNAYFAMPFAKSARIEVETGPIDPTPLYYHIDWHRYTRDKLDEPMRFHAKWRREYPAEAFGEEFTVLDAVGRGQLLGFVYGVRLCDGADRWSHGGAENIYIDGESNPAFLRGSGGEDTFGASYGGALHEPHSHPDAGIPYYTHEDTGEPRPAQRVAAYRFFEQDAIPFERSVHFRFGCLANDICSTAYWYQDEPHREFARMPAWDRVLPATELRRGECDVDNEGEPAWWLCGPFENAEDCGMTCELPPELDFDPDATYDQGVHTNSPWCPCPEAPEQNVARWVRRPDIHNFIDFNLAFRPRTRGVSTSWPATAVATAVLEVAEACDAVLHVAWDDELTLTLNDAELMRREHNPQFRESRMLVRLEAGPNPIVLKLSNSKGTTWGAWCFAFRAEHTDGTPIVPQPRTPDE